MTIDPIEKLLKEHRLELSIAEAIFDGTDDGILIIDPKYKLLYQNKATRDVLGKHLGDYCYKVIQKREEPCSDCPGVHTFQDGKVHKAEKQVTTPKGIMHVEVMASPIKNAAGETVAVAELIRVITERKLLEKENEELIQELKTAMAEIKSLKGIFPICSFCKKIRDDKGFWNQVEVYIKKHSEADFSHSVCPECAKIHYPDFIPEEK